MARKKSEVTAPLTKQLEIQYVPLSAARRWERNPKLHNLDEIIAAIQKYGFQDPPAWDATLNNGEGGLKHGSEGDGWKHRLCCAPAVYPTTFRP